MWRLNRDWIAGALLLFVGVLVLGRELFPDLVPLVPLLAGGLVLSVFLIVRAPATLVTGGVLVGVGIGVLVARGSSPAIGAAGVLACIGAGFLLVWVLGEVLGLHEMRLWPLVPGLGLVAAAVAVYALDLGESLLRIAIDWWPLLPIAVGVWLMIGARSQMHEHEPEDETSRHPGIASPHDREEQSLREEIAARVAAAERARAGNGGSDHDTSAEATAHDQPHPLDPPEIQR